MSGYEGRDPRAPPEEVKPYTFLLKRPEKLPLAKPSRPRASKETLGSDLTGWVNDARMQDTVFPWSNFKVDNKDTSTQAPYFFLEPAS